MKKFLLVVVCIHIIFIFSLWPQGNGEQTVVRKTPHKEENVNSKFNVTDAAQNIEMTGGMQESELPQSLPNADVNASIIIYKLPQTEEAFNYITEAKVRQ